MEIKITEDKKQPLFSRRLVVADVEFGEGKTPSRAELRSQIAKLVKVESKLLSVRKIVTGYGLRKATVEAYAYSSEAELEKLEPKHIKKRHASKAKEGEEAQAQAAEPAAAAAAKTEGKAE